MNSTSAFTRMKCWLTWAAMCLAIWPALLHADTKRDGGRILLDDFETAPTEWKYIGGWEFPGAKGGLELDSAVAHSGKRSYRLDADFTGGGAYVGTWKDLESLKGQDINELRMWMKSKGVTTLSVRLVDSSDQCHQSSRAITLPADSEWHEVRLKIADVVGGEHWGGANDGKWHGPIKGFGINIGKDALAAGTSKATLYLDDIEATPGPVIDGHPTLLTATTDPAACRPGFDTHITYRWDAQPMGRDYTIYVHFLAPDGRMASQNDHVPPTGTSIWSGHMEYTNHVLIPTDMADGEYRIIVGLYDRRASSRNWDHPPLKAGPGVTPENPGGTDQTSFQVGTLKVDSKAPLPKRAAPTLNLDGYVMTFHDDFDDLSLSNEGSGTRWYTGTKENFGDAQFVEQRDGFPFSVKDGILRIEAAKRDGKWQAGLMASVNKKGEGFSQQYGYFEMRAKFPSSLGMWPAFWLLGKPALLDRSRPNPEFDIVEHYGVMPTTTTGTLHLWFPDGKHTAQGDFACAPGLTEGFHTYGLLIDESNTIWYLDGVEYQRQPTPPEAKVPLYIVVNLAMGGGWPIDRAKSPSYMEVDYVRAYAKRH